MLAASGRSPTGLRVRPLRPCRAPLRADPRANDLAVMSWLFYSVFSRRMPSIVGCQPNTSEIMNPSMRMSPGPLSLTVDL